jgi:hypothetical protein
MLSFDKRSSVKFHRTMLFRVAAVSTSVKVTYNNSLVINSPIFTQQILGMVLSDQFFDQGPHFWLGRIHGWWTKLDWQNHIGISVYL